jgi:hypothetical protein
LLTQSWISLMESRISPLRGRPVPAPSPPLPEAFSLCGRRLRGFHLLGSARRSVDVSAVIAVFDKPPG